MNFRHIVVPLLLLLVSRLEAHSLPRVCLALGLTPQVFDPPMGLENLVATRLPHLTPCLLAFARPTCLPTHATLAPHTQQATSNKHARRLRLAYSAIPKAPFGPLAAPWT